MAAALSAFLAALAVVAGVLGALNADEGIVWRALVVWLIYDRRGVIGNRRVPVSLVVSVVERVLVIGRAT